MNFEQKMEIMWGLSAASVVAKDAGDAEMIAITEAALTAAIKRFSEITLDVPHGDSA